MRVVGIAYFVICKFVSFPYEDVIKDLLLVAGKARENYLPVSHAWNYGVGCKSRVELFDAFTDERHAEFINLFIAAIVLPTQLTEQRATNALEIDNLHYLSA